MPNFSENLSGNLPRGFYVLKPDEKILRFFGTISNREGHEEHEEDEEITSSPSRSSW
jgi:hypothetical protein